MLGAKSYSKSALGGKPKGGTVHSKKVSVGKSSKLISPFKHAAASKKMGKR